MTSLAGYLGEEKKSLPGISGSVFVPGTFPRFPVMVERGKIGKQNGQARKKGSTFMSIFQNSAFMSGGHDQDTYTFFCRFCHFKVRFKLNPFFDATTIPLGRMILLVHCTICHWNAFTLKENFAHIGKIFVYLLLFIVFQMAELIHGVLWSLTFPFWWLHEHIL